MSTLKAQIHDAMKAAMRAQDKARLSTIRLIQSDIKRIEVDERIEVDDARLLAILDKMVKQRRESIAQFQAASRQDLVDKENAEVTVIQEFLPKALTADEINALIGDAIAASGASSMQDMGKVMAILKPQVQGRADVAEVSKLVKARIS
jgi:uncharacterized protein YqeY